jgi:hypothetical protein
MILTALMEYAARRSQCCDRHCGRLSIVCGTSFSGHKASPTSRLAPDLLSLFSLATEDGSQQRGAFVAGKLISISSLFLFSSFFSSYSALLVLILM